MGTKGSKGERNEDVDKAFQKAQMKLSQLGGAAGAGGGGETALAVQRFAAEGSILSRVNECMSRQGKDFVRDEYMAILLTLDPTQDVNAISAMTVGALRKGIRAAVVNNKLETAHKAETQLPTIAIHKDSTADKGDDVDPA
jgi:hypothetical protein